MVAEDVRVLPQVSKRHGGEYAQPPSNTLKHTQPRPEFHESLYLLPSPLFSILCNQSFQIPTSATNPTWRQSCNHRKLELQRKSIHSTHISPTPTNKTTKPHAHPTKVTTPPSPIRTPQPNLRPRPPAASPNRPLRLANNGGKRKDNNNSTSQPPHTRQLCRPPTHMSPNPRRDQLATLRTKRLYYPSYACHAPRCLPGTANSCADRRHGGSAMEAGSRCHGGLCVLCDGMDGHDCE